MAATSRKRSRGSAQSLSRCVVRDPLRRLQGQLEPLRRLPALHPPSSLLVRHAIERVVDLDGGEALRVVRQHLRRSESSPGRSCPSTPDSCSRTFRPRWPCMLSASGSRSEQAPVLAEMPDGVLRLAERLVEPREIVVAVGQTRILADRGSDKPRAPARCARDLRAARRD